MSTKFTPSLINKNHILNFTNSKKCIICLEKGINTTCIPCGHTIMCEECGDVIKTKCPLCRDQVDCVIGIENSIEWGMLYQKELIVTS